MEPLERIDTRLERMEGKIDAFLDRTARTEERVENMRGHFRIAVSIILAGISGLATMIIRNLLGGK